jgi:hypothetical protein
LLDKVDEVWWAKLSESYQGLGPGIDRLMEEILCDSLQLVSIAAADGIQ